MHKKISLFFLQLLMVMPFIFSQESSVYSRFGLGLAANLNSNAANMMGGLGATHRSIEGPSYINPASLSAVSLISFDIGVSGTFGNVKTIDTKAKQNSFNLDYLSLSVPVKKFWTTSVALLPFSKKDYQVSAVTGIDSVTSYFTETNGNGTLNQIAWSNGFKVKDVSFGVGVGYIFGKLDDVSATTLQTNGAADAASYTSYQKNTYKAKALNVDAGIQYQLNIKNKKDTSSPYKMILGFAVNTPIFLKNQQYDQQLKSFYNQLLEGRGEDESLVDFINDKVENNTYLRAGYPSNWESYVPDTFSIQSNKDLKMKAAPAYNIGVSFLRDYKFKVGVDFRYQAWSQYEGYEANAASELDDSWRLGLGAEVIPNIKKYNKFFSKLKYRAGFYYSKTNISIRNQDINEFGIDFGIGVPMFNRFSGDEGFMQSYITYPFNIGFQIGRRGTTNDNLIQENFVRLRLGFSLNDKWFVKRKYY
jgi:hypothetical protein